MKRTRIDVEKDGIRHIPILPCSPPMGNPARKRSLSPPPNGQTQRTRIAESRLTSERTSQRCRLKYTSIVYDREMAHSQ